MDNPKSNFLSRIANARQHQESGAAMMFAIIVLLVCTVLAIIVAMFTGTSIAATRALGKNINYNAAVQDALANAYLGANSANSVNFLNSHAITNPTQTSCQNAKAVSGMVPKDNMTIPARWTWYSERVAATGGQIEFYIFAYGYDADGSCTDQTARRVRVSLTPLNATSACYTTGGGDCLNNTTAAAAASSQTIIYYNSDQALFAYGLLGVNGVQLGTSSSVFPKMYSYDSGVTNVPNASNDSGNSTVATNNRLRLFSNNTNLKTFIKLKNSSCVDQTNGDADACEKLYTDTRNYTANINTLDSNSYLASCTNGPAWTASSNVPLNNYGCYSSITFDKTFTTQAAVKAYTYGPITVNPGVSVNFGFPSTNLSLFSSNTACSLGVGANTNDITQFSGLIAGTKLNCADTAGTGKLNYYGSMAASTVALTNPGTSFYQDEAARALSTCTAATNCRILWATSAFTSLN